MKIAHRFIGGTSVPNVGAVPAGTTEAAGENREQDSVESAPQESFAPGGAAAEMGGWSHR